MLITEIVAAKHAAQNEIAKTITELCKATGITTWQVQITTHKISHHEGSDAPRTIVTNVELIGVV